MGFITSIPTFILNILRKLVGLPLTIIVLVFLITFPAFAVYLNLLDTRRGIERLEQDLVVVQSTQFNLLQELSSKSATNSATISGKVK